MASERRIQKLNQVLREELAKIIYREIEFPEGLLVTLTRAAVSSDARYATVFISFWGGSVKGVLETLEKNVYNIQQLLNKKLRMRPVPKIQFAIDDAETKRETVEKSLAELRKKEEI